MRLIRVIPALLLQQGGLVKTTRFKDPVYIGDPINAVRIFNDKEADELLLLDISATAAGKQPDMEHIREIVSEAFMPIAYGGGVNDIETIRNLLLAGVEKVVLGTAAHTNPSLIKQAAERFGSQAIIVSVDVRKNFFGKNGTYYTNGKSSSKLSPVEFAQQAEANGAGELLLHHIDREGTRKGFDTELLAAVSAAVNIPVIACGGADTVNDFYTAVQHGASAVSAGSMFVFQGSARGVLISYPGFEALKKELYDRL